MTNKVFVCANCGGSATCSHTRESVERTVGPKQELIKPFVTGLGTWSCSRCGGKTKVRRRTLNEQLA